MRTQSAASISTVPASRIAVRSSSLPSVAALNRFCSHARQQVTIALIIVSRLVLPSLCLPYCDISTESPIGLELQYVLTAGG